MSKVLHGHARRLAQLDPFEPTALIAPRARIEAEAQAGISYGCVDWYVYQDRARHEPPQRKSGQ
ncbi:MAG TPA: hypothetical protein VKT54_14380 [Steroidobacteraceae bacterium]|nr:hypothetical protein [Steroidobacteraceae bacterium]